MKAVHFVLQGKGGVGKSFISSLLSQYFKSKDKTFAGFDTDPVNQSFGQIKTLGVTGINILTEDRRINTAQFDFLLDYLIHGNEQVSVVDNGAATFVPLNEYLTENNVIDLLIENNIKVYFHHPLVGGAAFMDTVAGTLEALRNWQQDTVVWLNDFQGKIETEDFSFKKSKIYQEHKKSIKGIVKLDLLNPDTFGKDVRSMTTKNLTFDEIEDHPDFSFMGKHRIKKFKNKVFSQLDEIFANKSIQEEIANET